jgi:hypothetical protein
MMIMPIINTDTIMTMITKTKSAIRNTNQNSVFAFVILGSTSYNKIHRKITSKLTPGVMIMIWYYTISPISSFSLIIIIIARS